MGNFLNPWAVLLGVAGLALPFLIHWLTKPRPLLMPLSTVRFVVEALKQTAWWHKVRDWLLLLLRAAAVALIAAAMARPLLMSKPQVASTETTNAVRVVVLDVSESMAAVENGIQVFERARAETAKYLHQGVGYHANLILAGATPRSTFPTVSNNLGALRTQLSEARPLNEQLHLDRALEAAAQMLAAAPEATRPELVVVSDFQRGNWVSADFSSLPENTKIELVSVASDQPPANAAVVAMRCEQRPAVGRPISVEVVVANFSPQPRRMKLQISAGIQIENTYVQCPPGGRTPLTIPLSMTTDGWQPVTAQLVENDDALPGDDRRSLVLNVRRSPRWALLTREEPQRPGTASYFIDRAMTSHDQHDGGPPTEVTWHNPDAVKPDTLTKDDGIVLVRPGRLSEGVVKQLVQLMRSGKAVLYVASDTIDAHNLGQLAATAGDDLQPPATLIPPPRAARRENLFLANFRAKEPPFAVFGDRLSALLRPLRFSGGLASQRSELALPEDLLASYNDNSVCLYLTPCGRGSLAVWNVNLTSTNLPSSGVFVPWMAELTRRQLSDGNSRGETHSGEQLIERLPPEVRDPSPLQLTLLSKAGKLPTEGSFGSLLSTDEGVLWEWERAGAPGVYQVIDRDHSSRVVYATCVTLPTVESDLTTLDAKLLTGRLSGGRPVHFQTAGRGESQDDVAWSWLAASCVGCILLEFLTLGCFRV